MRNYIESKSAKNKLQIIVLVLFSIFSLFLSSDLNALDNNISKIDKIDKSDKIDKNDKIAKGNKSKVRSVKAKNIKPKTDAIPEIIEDDGIRIGVLSADKDHRSMSNILCMEYSYYTQGKKCSTNSYDSEADLLKDLKMKRISFILSKATSPIFTDQNVRTENDIRFVYSLRKDFFTIISKIDSKVDALNDLEGKSVGIHDISGWGNNLFVDLLSLKNVGYSNNIKKGNSIVIHEVVVDNVASDLCSGKYDAVLLYSHGYYGAIKELGKLCQIKVMNLLYDKDVVSFLNRDQIYNKMDIVGGEYIGLVSPSETIGTKVVVLTSASHSNDEVFHFLRATVSNYKSLKKVTNLFTGLEEDEIIQPFNNVLLHDAVLKFSKIRKSRGYFHQ